MSSPPLRRPGSRRRAVTLLLTSLVTLARVEARIRRTSPVALGRQLGVGFSGFAVPSQEHRPLPTDVVGRWWAVEKVLALWPAGRDRRCLRRSLTLGHQLRHLEPVLCLEVQTLDPFLAHAYLAVHGQRLDMGLTGRLVPEST